MSRPEPSSNSLKSNEIQPATPAAEAPLDPVPRRFERFTLLSRVARGGMGEVYLATAESIEGAERPLIVKIVRRDHADDRSFVARFLDEARIQAQLQHPGVAQILEATTDSLGKPYVVVEHIEGRNLSDVRTRAGQLGARVSWQEAVAIGLCLGEALAHVHERTDAEGRPLEIVHRDLSPQNVMLGYGGEVKLIDFGTARGQNRRCQTIAGIVFAKPGYVAPEVANNAPGGVPADLYAFGVILWELLAGRRFLTGEASAHLAAVGAGKRSLPPLARIIDAPPEIDALIGRLTAMRIEDRFPSARAALQDLVKLLQRAPSLADGDRSVRGRISDLMRRLYPAEPARSRSDFARRVAEARSLAPRPLLAPLSPEPPEAVDPSVLAGTRYRLLREIGRGAMGVVHEAAHVDLGRTVALKLLEGDALSAAAQSRFRAEARAIAQLDHEHLVKIYDFGACQDGRLYYAMELLDGESLDKRLQREGKLGLEAALELALQTCRALDAAHRAGVIHRDIKPANLFVTRAGTLKVLDFGVAKAGPEVREAPGDGILLVGTPEYMAPEQARGDATPASDVYALATVVYELLTGSLPFQGDGPLVILAHKAGEPPIAPSTRVPGLGKALDRVLLRALSLEPAERPASVVEFARELELAAKAPSRPARAASPRAPALPARTALARRRGSVALGVVLAGCLSVLATAGARNAEVREQVGVLGERASAGVAWAEARVSAARAQKLASVSPPKPERAPAAPGVVHASVAPEAAAPLETTTDAEPESSLAAAAEPASPETTSTTEVGPPVPLGPPSDPAVAGVLAQAETLATEGKDLRALELLRRAAQKHGQSAEVLRALSRALSRNRSWGEALRVARRRVALDPSIEARVELARLERATGHRERAVALLAQVVATAGAPAEARELLRSLTGNERLALSE